MLVLTRKTREGIVVRTESGEEVAIYVSGVLRNGAVKIGIQAPKAIKIIRSELVDRVFRDGSTSTSTVANDDQTGKSREDRSP